MKPIAGLWTSIKLRLALLGALLIALSVAITVELTLRTVDDHDEQLAVSLSAAQTRRMAKLISARLVNLQLALRSGAETMDVSGALQATAAAEFLRLQPALSTLFDTQFVSDPQGRVLAFVDGKAARPIGMDISDRKYFMDTVAQRRPVISPAIVGRASNEAVVVLTMPVLDKAGRVHAITGGSLHLDPRDLMPEITAADTDDPALTVIIDASGRVLSHPDRQWLLRDAALDPALTEVIAHWVGQGRPVEPGGLAARVGDHLVSMAGVPDADWVVLRIAPASVVLAGGAAAQHRALWIGAAVAVAGGLLLLLATLLMLRPLRRLQDCALDAVRGRAVGAARWPSGSDEVGQVAQLLKLALLARDAADASSRELLEQLQAVMASSPVGIAFTRDGRLAAVNAHCHQLLGYPAETLVGQPASVIYTDAAFYRDLRERYRAAFDAGQPHDEEIELRRRDGSRFWGRQQGQPVRWGDASGGAVWTLEDVTEQRQHRERLAWASSHDSLTGLINRAEFERRLGALCHNRRREPSSALFIDLDRFKAVNDSAGHAAGDAMLIAVARQLAMQTRQVDAVARLGGDEFGVLLASCDIDGAIQVAQKMRAAVDALAMQWGDIALSVGASIGVVEVDATLHDAAAVLAAADGACYAAKQAGSDRVRAHVPAGLRLVGP